MRARWTAWNKLCLSTGKRTQGAGEVVCHFDGDQALLCRMPEGLRMNLANYTDESLRKHTRMKSNEAVTSSFILTFNILDLGAIAAERNSSRNIR